MRILFATFAVKTHLHPQIPIAWALRAAGHDVRVASQPDLVPDITGAGLTPVPVGEPLRLSEQMKDLDERRDEAGGADGESLEALDYLALTDMSELRPERLTYDYMHTRFAVKTMSDFQILNSERMVDDLVGFARDWKPDLVLWDTMTFAAPVAAAACGAAHARILFGLDLLARMRESYLEELAARPPGLRDDPMAEWLGWTLDRYGCEFTEDTVVGQWTIDPVPTSLRLPVDLHYVPVRYIPYNGPAVIPDWLREPPRRRRVCLTLGVSFRETMGGDRTPLAELLDAVADLDVEVVATLNARQLAELGRLPGNVRVVDYVPLAALIPSCAAIVHHGGSGTVTTALAAGVPQIIAPTEIWCNVHKAHKIQELGAGLYRRVDRFSADEFRNMLVRVLDDPAFTTHARSLRTEVMSTPAPAEITATLERLTTEYRRSGR